MGLRSACGSKLRIAGGRDIPSLRTGLAIESGGGPLAEAATCGASSGIRGASTIPATSSPRSVSLRQPPPRSAHSSRAKTSVCPRSTLRVGLRQAGTDG